MRRTIATIVTAAVVLGAFAVPAAVFFVGPEQLIVGRWPDRFHQL